MTISHAVESGSPSFPPLSAVWPSIDPLMSPRAARKGKDTLHAIRWEGKGRGDTGGSEATTTYAIEYEWPGYDADSG